MFSQKHSQNTTEPLPMETIKKFPKHIQSITKALPKALPKPQNPKTPQVHFALNLKINDIFWSKESWLERLFELSEYLLRACRLLLSISHPL